MGLFILLFFAVSIFAVNQWTRNQNAEKIAEINLAKQAAEQENEKLRADVKIARDKQEDLKKDISELEGEVKNHLATIAGNKQAIVELEDERKGARLNIRKLNTDDKVFNEFKAVYPEVIGANGFGTTVTDDGAGFEDIFIVMPLIFVKTFMLEHKDLGAKTATIAKYKENEKIYGSVVDLKTEITDNLKTIAQLEAQVSTAFQRGFEKRDAELQRERDGHIACLEQPRINLGGKFSFWGGALIGAAICGIAL